jgi:hypothetical protein
LHAKPHNPLAQLEVAFGRGGQATPHAPQFETVFVEVSQPFDAMPSQFAKPPLHAPSVHAELTHDAAAFAKLHTRPQPPQFVTDVLVFTSQPFAVPPSQFPNPGLQLANVHAPFEHAGVALANEHALPHVPQFVTDVFVFTSQPFVELPSQSAIGAMQLERMHTPPTQVALAPGNMQTLPHVPQLFVLVFRFVSQPFAAIRSQSAKPGAHAPIWHMPIEQAAAAFGNEQATPHPPQFDVVPSGVSQPLTGLASQSA